MLKPFGQYMKLLIGVDFLRSNLPCKVLKCQVPLGIGHTGDMAKSNTKNVYSTYSANGQRYPIKEPLLFATIVSDLPPNAQSSLPTTFGEAKGGEEEKGKEVCANAMRCTSVSWQINRKATNLLYCAPSTLHASTDLETHYTTVRCFKNDVPFWK
jgi:hypothetical protein